jgi:hypothetical protein
MVVIVQSLHQHVTKCPRLDEDYVVTRCPTHPRSLPSCRQLAALIAPITVLTRLHRPEPDRKCHLMTRLVRLGTVLAPRKRLRGLQRNAGFWIGHRFEALADPERVFAMAA